MKCLLYCDALDCLSQEIRWALERQGMWECEDIQICKKDYVQNSQQSIPFCTVFLNFEREESAARCIQMLHGKHIPGLSKPNDARCFLAFIIRECCFLLVFLAAFWTSGLFASPGDPKKPFQLHPNDWMDLEKDTKPQPFSETPLGLQGKAASPASFSPPTPKAKCM